MSLDTLILVFTCAINLSLGLFIFLRNPRLLSSISFFAITVSISGWTLSNYLTEDASVSLSVNALFNRLAYLFGLWCLVTIAAFCYSFPKRVVVARRKLVLFVIMVLCMSVLSATALVAGVVSKDTKGLHFSVGSLSTAYAVFLLALLISGAWRLIKSKRQSQNAEVRSQINLVLFGFSASVVMAVAMNVLLPIVVKNFSTARFGPLLTVVFVVATTYAIIRHRLFDVRLVVARSLAYLLSLASLGAVFILASFALTSFFLESNDLSSASVRWTFALLAVVLSYIFAPLKRFFDRITKDIFYRDSYDTQTFLDQLNNILVETFELKPLLRKSSAAIEENLKPTYTLFGLKETTTAPRRLIGTANTPSFTEEDIAFVSSLTPKMKRKMIITDLLEEEYADLQKVLQSNNVAVVVRLTTSAHEEGVGYLILGPKKSGNIYSTEDIKNIEIIANGLVIAIQNALRFEEIQNFNLTLQAKVDEATRKLRHSNEKLKELDETKDDFISMASHQLRTPLTSVKGYLSMVMEGDAGKLNPMQQKMLGQAYISSQRMVYMIADLLNVSRLKTGKFVIEPSPTNLATMVQEEIDQLHETAEARGVTLQYDQPDSFPDLMLDETKTRQVVMNFIDNAIYYTPAGGTIKIELADQPHSVELRVIDNGIGVPKVEQHHLFTKFYRAGNARKARPDGTGLGLFMAKKVVLAQGGTIIFDSHEGKGSTFGFAFHKSKLLATPQPQKSFSKEPATLAK